MNYKFYHLLILRLYFQWDVTNDLKIILKVLFAFSCVLDLPEDCTIAKFTWVCILLKSSFSEKRVIACERNIK